MNVLPDTDIGRTIELAVAAWDIETVHAVIGDDPVAAHIALVAQLGLAKARLNSVKAQITANRSEGASGRLTSREFHLRDAQLKQEAYEADRRRADIAQLVQLAQERRRHDRHDGEIAKQRAMNDRLWNVITQHHARSLELDIEPEQHDIELWAAIGIKVRQP